MDIEYLKYAARICETSMAWAFYKAIKKARECGSLYGWEL